METKIKFRGKGLGGEWHYGTLAHVTSKKIVPQGLTGFFISNSVGAPFAYPVRPETVGKFIGLHSNDRQELYEDDIIDVDGVFFVIKYKPEVARYLGYDPFGRFIDLCATTGTSKGFFISYDKKGNIHDNTEFIR